MKSMSNYMTMNIQICYFINLFKLTSDLLNQLEMNISLLLLMFVVFDISHFRLNKN